MLKALLARAHQGHRTMAYPAGEPPSLPGAVPRRARTRPREVPGRLPGAASTSVRRTRSAGGRRPLALDLGRCLFCTECVTACPEGAIAFSNDYRLATRRREDLVVRGQELALADALEREAPPPLRPLPEAAGRQRGGLQRLQRRRQRPRARSAGTSDASASSYVASPRHADGLLDHGPRDREHAARAAEDLRRGAAAEDRHRGRCLRDQRRALRRPPGAARGRRPPSSRSISSSRAARRTRSRSSTACCASSAGSRNSGGCLPAEAGAIPSSLIAGSIRGPVETDDGGLPYDGDRSRRGKAMTDPKLAEKIAAATAVFAKDEGTWDAEMEIRPGPGAEPLRQKGVSTNKRIGGGRWLVVDFRAETGFEGHGIYGWDASTEKYTGVWVDSMQTAISRAEGKLGPRDEDDVLPGRGDPRRPEGPLPRRNEDASRRLARLPEPRPDARRRRVRDDPDDVPPKGLIRCESSEASSRRGRLPDDPWGLAESHEAR